MHISLQAMMENLVQMSASSFAGVTNGAKENLEQSSKLFDMLSKWELRAVTVK